MEVQEISRGKKRQGKKMHKAERKKSQKKDGEDKSVRRSDRKRKIVDYNEVVNDKSEENQKPTNERPTCFGQYIKHKWKDVDDERNQKDEWHTGWVIGFLDNDEYSSESEFQVAYDVDNDNDLLKLL